MTSAVQALLANPQAVTRPAGDRSSSAGAGPPGPRLRVAARFGRPCGV